MFEIDVFYCVPATFVIYFKHEAIDQMLIALGIGDGILMKFSAMPT